MQGDVLGQNGNGKCSETWADSRYILKRESTGFAEGLDQGGDVKEREESKTTQKVSSWATLVWPFTTGRRESSIYWVMGEERTRH